MWNKNFISRGVACLLVTGPFSGVTPVHAEDQLQMHGFASQAVAYTSDNNYGGKSDDGVAWDLRELGLNLSYRPNADWLFSGQALARWAGATDDGGLRLDYGFIDRTLFDTDADRVGIQLGKVKNPYGLYNTTRDVAFTRPGILMPQSIYLDRVRNFFLASPGVSAYGNHVRESLDVSWRLNVMRMDSEDKDMEYLFLLQDGPGSYEGKTSWLGQIMTDWDGGKLRLGLTAGLVKTRYAPFQAESVLRPLVLSAEWNQERWSLTAEYEQVKNRGKNYLGLVPPGSGPEDPNTVEAWYVQGAYRLTPQLQVYLRRDAFYFDKDDKSGTIFAKTSPPLSPSLMYSKDWTLGVRRDWGNWTFSGEIHDMAGTAWLSPLDTPVLPTPAKDWRMVLLQAAYRF